MILVKSGHVGLGFVHAFPDLFHQGVEEYIVQHESPLARVVRQKVGQAKVLSL
jgi:hypothetical protein